MITALYSVEVRTVFLNGARNRKADNLSRWHLDSKFATQVEQLTREQTMKQVVINDKDFDFIF